MEFQWSYFKSWKMTLWKCCTQYASKFGKLSSGHRTEKGPFSFQSQRKAMPKNAQTTTQLHSSHMLVKWCSKFSKPVFGNMWTVNFLMIQQMLAIWSLVPLPFLKPAWASGSSQFTYCWSLAWRILSITLLVCEMSAIVQRMLKDTLSILWHCLYLWL